MAHREMDLCLQVLKYVENIFQTQCHRRHILQVPFKSRSALFLGVREYDFSFLEPAHVVATVGWSRLILTCLPCSVWREDSPTVETALGFLVFLRKHPFHSGFFVSYSHCASYLQHQTGMRTCLRGGSSDLKGMSRTLTMEQSLLLPLWLLHLT